MVQPPKPWPEVLSPDDALSAIVAEGDVESAREFLENTFWDGRPFAPNWGHLKMALLQQNKPMVRLLVTWGAMTTSEELSVLRYSSVYEPSVRMLRRCGLKVDFMLEKGEERTAPAKIDASPAAQIPAEWRKVLEHFQDKGAKEAMIAGGALRDLFNGRAIKDVDIFMPTRGSKRKNRAFLKEVFKAAGLNVEKQTIGCGYSLSMEEFPDPASDLLPRDGKTESWMVIAGPRQTEYNVVFTEHSFKYPDDLLSAFDFGLCQIGYDGKKITRKTAYEDAVREKKISLCQKNRTSLDHLQRIMKKYPDWKLCNESLKLLRPSPPLRGLK
jgi:hypothetical protein